MAEIVASDGEPIAPPPTDKGFIQFDFKLQTGMIVESMVVEGNTNRRLRGIVISVTDMEIVLWPIDTTIQQTQMTVLPRQTAQYTILRSARLDEIRQAEAGIQSVVDNWHEEVKKDDTFVQASPLQSSDIVNEKPKWS